MLAAQKILLDDLTYITKVKQNQQKHIGHGNYLIKKNLIRAAMR